MTHFELIFLCSIRYLLKKMFLHMDMHYLLKILYFCTEFPLNIFKRVLSIYAWIYFWSLYSLFMSIWHCFNQ